MINNLLQTDFFSEIEVTKEEIKNKIKHINKTKKQLIKKFKTFQKTTKEITKDLKQGSQKRTMKNLELNLITTELNKSKRIYQELEKQEQYLQNKLNKLDSLEKEFIQNKNKLGSNNLIDLDTLIRTLNNYKQRLATFKQDYLNQTMKVEVSIINITTKATA